MMKLLAMFRGRPTLVLGLSHKNLDRLRRDGLSGAIEIKGEELGLSHDIYITAAETELDMFEAFQDGIGDGTTLRIDKRLKS